MKMNPVIEGWLLGSRKFLVMLAILVIAVVFRISGWIDGGQMVDLVKMVGISFMGANSVEYMMAPIQAWAAGKFTSTDGDK